MSDYRVQLDSFSGPMDLLLYLVRRNEVDVVQLPIAKITHQFLQFLEVLPLSDHLFQLQLLLLQIPTSQE